MLHDNKYYRKREKQGRDVERGLGEEFAILC